MADPTIFEPPRRRGLMIHIVAFVGLLSVSVGSLFLALNVSVGAGFVLLVVISILSFLPLPVILYRGYALSRARYIVEREGLRLRWGLRAEDIPISEVEWVRPASDMPSGVPTPVLAWTGALLGHVRIRDLGPTEFMASELGPLLLVATPQKVFAISPADPNAFLRTFRRTMELGSIQPLESRSVQPTAYAQTIWQDRLARWLVGAGLVLALLLFIVVSLMSSSRPAIPLGFAADGQTLPPVPSEQLLLLVVLGTFSLVVDLASGVFFYRQEANRPLAYILWGTGILAPSMLLLGALFLYF